ncbi:hypothetical protein VTI74DRAFT_4981 [Chaetomium olivicolor]
MTDADCWNKAIVQVTAQLPRTDGGVLRERRMMASGSPRSIEHIRSGEGKGVSVIPDCLSRALPGALLCILPSPVLSPGTPVAEHRIRAVVGGRDPGQLQPMHISLEVCLEGLGEPGFCPSQASGGYLSGGAGEELGGGKGGKKQVRWVATLAFPLIQVRLNRGAGMGDVGFVAAACSEGCRVSIWFKLCPLSITTKSRRKETTGRGKRIYPRYIVIKESFWNKEQRKKKRK